MARRIRTFVIVLSCLQLCLGADAFYQIVAWSGMLVNYSSEAGLAAGVEMTFDGHHPCCLCKAIADSKKRQDESKDGPAGVSKLHETWRAYVAPATTDVPVPRSVDFPDAGFVALASRDLIAGKSPPVPPPRAGQA